MIESKTITELRIDPSDTAAILKFLTAIKGFKQASEEFKTPRKLGLNPFSFPFKDREVSLHTAYKLFARRLALRKRVTPDQAATKDANPLFALQAAPGGGKSTFLDELAALREDDLNALCTLERRDRRVDTGRDKGKEKEGTRGEERQSVNIFEAVANSIYVPEEVMDEMRAILKNSIPVCITFNATSPVSHFEESLALSERLALRILWSYFFSQLELEFESFLKQCLSSMERLPAIGEAIACVRFHGGNDRSVLLCVDEFILAGDFVKADKNEKLKLLISQVCAVMGSHGPEEFNFIVSTLDAAPVVNATSTDSKRPLYWVPLPPLTQSSAEELFAPLLRDLAQARLETIQMVIADCGGHPRTLEALFDILSNNVVRDLTPAAQILDLLSEQPVVKAAQQAHFEAAKVNTRANPHALKKKGGEGLSFLLSSLAGWQCVF